MQRPGFGVMPNSIQGLPPNLMPNGLTQGVVPSLVTPGITPSIAMLLGGGGDVGMGPRPPVPPAQPPPRTPWPAASVTSTPHLVPESDQEMDFEVVHDRVIIRTQPSTVSPLLGAVDRGQMVTGVPYIVDDNPWLCLNKETFVGLQGNKKWKGEKAWMLIDGRSVGLGELLREVRRSGAEPAEEEGGAATGDAAAGSSDRPGHRAKPRDDAQPSCVTSVAFWGICDIKYDPRLPERDRVRVLELGDGRTSRFSHHGRPIKERFETRYCMDEAPIKRSVLVENKKFTHDMFCREGFSHLRPPTATFPRRYTPALAQEVLAEVGAGAAGLVVLKLCNRSRGAGIVVVHADDLDGVLKTLLTPPQGSELDAWLEKRAPNALGHKFESQFEETCLHWWSNECPLFVAELCCHSEPVSMAPGDERYFDGTMRVAFALYRRPSKYAWDGMRTIKPFEIDWLGGYWKLPPTPSAKGDGGKSLADLHCSIVSSFNSVEKRTAEVPADHLQEVYDALTPALPNIFHAGGLGVQTIRSVYETDPLFCAFALSRAAAVMRTSDMGKAIGLFDLARKMAAVPPAPFDAGSLPERAVHSYIERNVGVCFIMQSEWVKAGHAMKAALRLLPSNATAYYLKGYCEQELSSHDASVTSMLRSIALDPDYKSSFLGLSNAYLVLGQFEKAIEASEKCMLRHPDTPQAHFNIGQALYQLLKARGAPPPAADAMFRRAKESLFIASKRADQWTEEDSDMMDFITAGTLRTNAPSVKVHPWKVYGFRP